MTIKILEKTPGCAPVNLLVGDWFDLTLAEDVSLKGPHAKTLHRYKQKEEQIERLRDVAFDSAIVKLGICAEVPKGYECVIVPRSSTFKKYGIIQSNHLGVVDYSYNSDEDEWKMPIVAMRKTFIPKGTRIAQFRVQLSQKATVWQKIKWLFSNSIKFKKVTKLHNEKRGGFGSTGN